jgi:hypothetical protein
MRITDIIRGVLDLADMAGAASAPVQKPMIVAVDQPDVEQAIAPEQDLIAVLQKLSGLEAEADCGIQTQYANEPNEITAPVGAAFPGGDDVHQKKNPADIRTNAPSMYPGYQAGAR